MTPKGLRWVLGGTPTACPIVIVQYLWTIDGSNNRRRIIGDSYTGGGVVLLVAADCPANQENCVRLSVCSLQLFVTIWVLMDSDEFWWILMDFDRMAKSWVKMTASDGWSGMWEVGGGGRRGKRRDFVASRRIKSRVACLFFKVASCRVASHAFSPKSRRVAWKIPSVASHICRVAITVDILIHFL